MKYPVTDYLAYVCGKAGKANPKLSPVYIGIVNGAQGGPQDVDDNASTAASMTVQYINQHLGGIDGHPLVEVFCSIPETVAGATQCGQEMANNPKIHVVVVATVITVGDQAFESALAPTKKLLILFVGSGTDLAYRNALWLYGSSTSLEGPFATFIKRKHVKHVAMIGPAGVATTDSFQAVAAGLKLEHISYNEVTYDPSTTDLTAPVEAANVSQAQMIFTTVSFTGCSDLYLALKQLAVTVPVTDSGPLCILPSVATADGGSLPANWYYGIGSPLDSDTSDPSGAAYNKVSALYGESALNADNWMQSTMSEVLTAARFMNQVGATGETPSTLNKVAFAWHGPMMWGAPQTICGTVHSAPQICLDEIQIFESTGGTQLLNAGHGWVSPPVGVKISAG